jgi:hypothetical protein
MGVKTIIIDFFSLFNCTAGRHSKWDPERSEMQPFYLPFPQGGMIPHLLCCPGFAVKYYSFTLDA